MDVIKKFEPLFGDWYIESFIGAGSFGRVYKAYREEFGEKYYSAIKYFSIPASEEEVNSLREDGMDEKSISTYYSQLVRDITEETRLMSQLRGYSNIVSFEASRIQPKPSGIGYDVFIRMELLESLSARVMRAPLTRAKVITLGMDICTALDVCAKKNIIHRDIKPDNIFENEYGNFKLGDFGIARQLEKTTTFMSKKGTYNYMAPEVYKDEKYGANCDIYSLGIVMYRLMNRSRLPFLPPAPQPITPQDKETSLSRRMRGEPMPAPCDADPALARIILKACAYDPRARYQTAKEMYDDLFALQYGVGAKPATGSPAPAQPGGTAPYNRGGYSAPAGSHTGYAAMPVNTGNNGSAVNNGYVPSAGSSGAYTGYRGMGNPNPVSSAQQGGNTAGTKPRRSKKGIVIAAAVALGILLTTLVLMLAAPQLFGHGDGENTGSGKNSSVFASQSFEAAFREKYGVEGKVTEEDLLDYRKLDLSGMGLTNIYDLAKFKNLTELRLGYRDSGDGGFDSNNFTDISALSALTKLQYLDLDGNMLSDLSPLSGLTDLEYLSLGGTGISDLSALRDMTEMQTLNLSDNAISDLTPLESMRKLTTLKIGNNSVSNISVIRNMTKLQAFYANNNSITSVRVLGALDQLSELWLVSNPLSAEQIAELQSALPYCNIHFW
ncbi:MAG: protein kinase [Clostridia bacterium]|nr:protein kinase [Clostridia bacterium]